MGERTPLLCRWFGHTNKRTHPAHRVYWLHQLSGIHGAGRFDIECRCDRCNHLYRIGFGALAQTKQTDP